MANKERLFEQFPPVETAQWEAVIAADLKGADRDKKLVWRTAEGFEVQPYYRAENLEGIPFLGTKAGEAPYLRGVCECNDWRVHQTIEVTDVRMANAEALAILDGGCTSVGFCVTRELTAADLDVLLSQIVIGACEIVFCGSHVRTIANLLLDKLDAMAIDPAEVRVSFAIDPIVKKLSLGGSMCSELDGCFGNIRALVDSFVKYPKVRLVSVGGENFGNSGSTIVQELAFALAVGKEYVANGVEADRVRFSFSVSSNYFMEIAKFRAARVLWSEISGGAKIFAHAVTSRWNQTIYDPHTNMLRGTTEAMSAAIAGVHSLEVVPFDAPFEKAGDFSRRIARNVQLLLKHEAHFDSVVDPAGGSYYIENLTNSILTECRKLLAEIDEKGGYVSAFKAGFVVAAVEESAAAKDKAVATRRTVLLGANQYPNFTETSNVVLPEYKAEGNVLKPYRGAMAFEAIRLAADKSGKEVKAFMLTCGTLSMARARAQFACNFFATAGIRVQDNTFFASVEEGVAAAIKAHADIVVVCAADDDYATVAPEVYRLIGGKAIVVVAGAPASQSELEAAGISHFISVRSNVLETLKSYLKELGIL